MNDDVMRSVNERARPWLCWKVVLIMVVFQDKLLISCQTMEINHAATTSLADIAIIQDRRFKSVIDFTTSTVQVSPNSSLKTQRQGRDVNNITSGNGAPGIILVRQHETISLPCVTGDERAIGNSVWLKDGQIVDVYDRGARGVEVGGHRFIRERGGGVLIDRVLLEDNGKWKCEAEDEAGFLVAGYSVELIVLDRPKPPYLLIDGRRLDPGNMFIPVKENGELAISCVAEAGNPSPKLLWRLALSPNIDLSTHEHSNLDLDLQVDTGGPEDTTLKSTQRYIPGTGARSDASLKRVLRAHHNATILCLLQHPALNQPLNASLLLDVQYAPSFGISRIPGFGFPLREGIPVSLKCDVDSNPPSTPVWQKDDGDTPVPQSGDGFLNFTAIKRDDSGWYKCTSRHMLGRFSSIGYFLNIRYDAPEVTQEPDNRDLTVHQVEVAVGGSVHLQCPTGTVGCWGKTDLRDGQPRGLGMSGARPAQGMVLHNLLYRDAGIYRCFGQTEDSDNYRIEVLRTIELSLKGAPLINTPMSQLNLSASNTARFSAEFCANPPATRILWLNGEQIYRPGIQYAYITAHNITNTTKVHCHEASITISEVSSLHSTEFIFLVKSPNGLAETTFVLNLLNTKTKWIPSGCSQVQCEIICQLSLLIIIFLRQIQFDYFYMD